MKRTITAVRELNNSTGHFFFSRGAMRFFNSRIEGGTYNASGRCLFVTSEQFSEDSPRRFTIRESLESGKIETVGEFQQYATKSNAVSAIKTMEV